MNVRDKVSIDDGSSSGAGNKANPKKKSKRS